jgi:TRAP-type C4-dicarboxylate transport system permease small subunit
LIKISKLAKSANGLFKTLWSVIILTCLIGIFIGLVVQIITRYVINRPVSGIEEITLILFGWMVFVGAVIPVRDGEMISMDFIVSALLPTWIKRIISAMLELLSLIVCAYFSVGAYNAVMRSTMRFRMTVTGIPWRYFYLAGLLFFIGATLFGLWRFWRILRYGNVKIVGDTENKESSV